MEDKRTYSRYCEWAQKSKQIEYTSPTPLLDADGKVLAKGWARRNYFDFDVAAVSPRWRKEWEFYLVNNGRQMGLVSIVKVALAGYINVAVVDTVNGGFLESSTIYFLGKKCKLPQKGDVCGGYSFCSGDASFEVKCDGNGREIHFHKGSVDCDFKMDLFPNHQNITTVLPFYGDEKKFFLTTKQNSMPCFGTYKNGEKIYSFDKSESFCCMDWGRICAPRKVNWFWGNGSDYVEVGGQKHVFGFELTWGIGDESNATETCLFFDGVAHKIGAVDVEVFPKPDKYMQPWHVVSEDGRFDMTMTPQCDNHTDTKIGSLLRMHGHQVFGRWSGKAVLDDGTEIVVKDMFAFCEYVENKW